MNDAWLLIAIACIAAVFGGLDLARYRRTQRILSQQHLTMRHMQSDIQALCTGAINMSRHIEVLEQRARRLAERQDQMDTRDPIQQAYTHAIRLAQKGADVNELVENCGLVRGEAELLSMVHSAKRSKTASA